jgi:hypothetical protein
MALGRWPYSETYWENNGNCIRMKQNYSFHYKNACKMEDLHAMTYVRTNKALFLEAIQPFNSMVNWHRVPHQAMWLYHALVDGEEATLVIGKGRKGLHTFTHFLQLQTHWRPWRIIPAMFTCTLNWGLDFMYGPEFHYLNGGDTLDQETLNWGIQWIISYGTMAGVTKNELKMQENSRLRNLKSGFYCKCFQICLSVDLTYNGWSDIHEDGKEFDSTRISWACTKAVSNYDWITNGELQKVCSIMTVFRL